MANEDLRKKREEEDRRRESADLLFAYTHPGHIFEHERWDVRWLGWRIPVDAVFEYGVWLATNTAIRPGYIASTTLGVCQYYPNDMARIDVTTIVRGHSAFFMDDKERIEAMAKAGKALLRMVEAENTKYADEELRRGR